MAQSFTNGLQPLTFDLIAFSHLRWNSVWQRPQHLMIRWAKQQRVFYIEQPRFGFDHNSMQVEKNHDVHVVIPQLTEPSENNRSDVQQLIKQFIKENQIEKYILWYWTPMALPYTRQLNPSLIIYDCMEEMATFLDAPPLLREYERELLNLADLVFTGDQNLYEAKRHEATNIHSLEDQLESTGNFFKARFSAVRLPDQSCIPHPRLGFYGIIDERVDFNLLTEIALARPAWHFILVGPVIKLDPAALPSLPNIHYLGPKTIEELPAYLAGWDVALLPLSRTVLTNYISPSKLPKYLAAGKPVVSTVADPVKRYDQLSLIHVADSAHSFLKAIETALRQKDTTRWFTRIDALLKQVSWDQLWSRMNQRLARALSSR